MSQQDTTKERLLKKLAALLEEAFEAGRAEGRELVILEGKELALSRIRTVIDFGGDAVPERPVRKPPAPTKQRSLSLNRAAAGSIIEIVEKLLEEDTSAEGLRPSRAVALARARNIALKESSARMALFSLGKRGKALQAENKAWFHMSRKSAALAGETIGTAGSERADRGVFN